MTIGLFKDDKGTLSSAFLASFDFCSFILVGYNGSQKQSLMKMAFTSRIHSL
jgi:tRNA 2-selenouridine synthase SelU